MEIGIFKLEDRINALDYPVFITLSFPSQRTGYGIKKCDASYQ